MSHPVQISVCMAAYNAAPFLSAAITSVLSQSFRDFELLIVDDGSRDGTPEIVRQFARSDPRVKLLQNDENRGLVYSRNRILQSATAPFVAIADADDICEPTRLEKQIGWLLNHPETGVCGTAVTFIGDHPPDRRDEVAVFGEAQIRFFMRLLPCFWNTTTMYRLALLKQAGGYRAGFDAGAEDYDLWARLLPMTRFANLPEPLVKVRVHAASVTAQGNRCFENVLKVSARLLEDYLQQPVPVAIRTDFHAFLMRGTIESLACERAFRFALALYRQARLLETPETLRALSQLLAPAAWTHARNLVYAASGLSREMAWSALRMQPSLLARGETWGYALRTGMPRTATRWISQRRRPARTGRKAV